MGPSPYIHAYNAAGQEIYNQVKDSYAEQIAALAEGGVRVLDRDWVTCQAAGLEVGIVGVKGSGAGVGGEAGAGTVRV